MPAHNRCRLHDYQNFRPSLPQASHWYISIITVNGDKASVTVIKEGLNTPTAVEPAGNTIWIAERGTGKAESIPMPK